MHRASIARAGIKLAEKIAEATAEYTADVAASEAALNIMMAKRIDAFNGEPKPVDPEERFIVPIPVVLHHATSISDIDTKTLSEASPPA